MAELLRNFTQDSKSREMQEIYRTQDYSHSRQNALRVGIVYKSHKLQEHKIRKYLIKFTAYISLKAVQDQKAKRFKRCSKKLGYARSTAMLQI